MAIDNRQVVSQQTSESYTDLDDERVSVNTPNGHVVIYLPPGSLRSDPNRQQMINASLADVARIHAELARYRDNLGPWYTPPQDAPTQSDGDQPSTSTTASPAGGSDYVSEQGVEKSA